MGEITNRRRGLAAAASLSVIAVLLAACSDGPSAPAPVYLRGASPMAANGPAPPWRENRIVTVRHGETLGDIAYGYHVPERSLIAINNLRPPYLLHVGDRIVLPDSGAPPVQQAMAPPRPAMLSPAPPQMAAVPPGAAAPGPASVQLAALPVHPIPPPAAQPQTLVVPPRPTTPASTVSVAPLAPATQIAAPTPQPTTPAQTVPAAPLAPSAQIAALPAHPTTPAQTVPAVPHPATLPQVAAAITPTQPPSPPASAAKVLPDIVPLDPPPKPTAAAAPPANPSDPPPVMPARNPAAALPLPGEPVPTVAMETPGGRFPWPVHGRVLASYGTAGGGAHNEGINIAAPLGTPVRSIDSGTVAYVGNEVKGYGNLVLVKHANGWISAYAHLDDVMVKKGDTVSIGEVIGKVGDTGAVGEPQLHFELRRGKKPVDPKEFLELAGSAAAKPSQKAG